MQEDAQPILEEAREAYGSMKAPDSFQLVQAAECLVLLSEPAEALALLSRVAQGKREAHWHHRQAQALRLSQRFDEALAEISQSLSDNADSKYTAAFFEEQWKIREAMGDGNAIESLRKAVAASEQDSKYGTALRVRLAEVEVRR